MVLEGYSRPTCNKLCVQPRRARPSTSFFWPQYRLAVAKFSKSRDCNKVPLFSEVPEFPYNRVSDRSNAALTPKPSSISLWRIRPEFRVKFQNSGIFVGTHFFLQHSVGKVEISSHGKNRSTRFSVSIELPPTFVWQTDTDGHTAMAYTALA